MLDRRNCSLLLCLLWLTGCTGSPSDDDDGGPVDGSGEDVALDAETDAGGDAESDASTDADDVGTDTPADSGFDVAEDVADDVPSDVVTDSGDVDTPDATDVDAEDVTDTSDASDATDTGTDADVFVPCEGPDEDMDGVCDDDDVCPFADDRADLDMDTIPDGCDACPGQDDLADADADGVPDGCDACTGDDMVGDRDDDGVCDDLDVCAGDDATGDTDMDGICDDLAPRLACYDSLLGSAWSVREQRSGEAYADTNLYVAGSVDALSGWYNYEAGDETTLGGSFAVDSNTGRVVVGSLGMTLDGQVAGCSVWAGLIEETDGSAPGVFIATTNASDVFQSECFASAVGETWVGGGMSEVSILSAPPDPLRIGGGGIFSDDTEEYVYSVDAVPLLCSVQTRGFAGETLYGGFVVPVGVTPNVTCDELSGSLVLFGFCVGEVYERESADPLDCFEEGSVWAGHLGDDSGARPIEVTVNSIGRDAPDGPPSTIGVTLADVDDGSTSSAAGAFPGRASVSWIAGGGPFGGVTFSLDVTDDCALAYGETDDGGLIYLEPLSE